MGRSHVAKVAEARLEQINRYCQVIIIIVMCTWLLKDTPTKIIINCVLFTSDFFEISVYIILFIYIQEVFGITTNLCVYLI